MSERQGFDSVDPELVDRFLAGECSEEEAAAVRRYLMVHPDVAADLRVLLASLDEASGHPVPPDSRTSLAALRLRLAARGAGEPTSPLPPRTPRQRAPIFPMLRRRPPAWYRAGRIAGVAAVLLAAVAIARHGPPVPVPAPPAAPEIRTFATRNAERSELRLPDGTRVRLAPATRLRVASDFGVERRDVYLEGEAYFDVAHDSLRPFTVFAGNASAQDLGTAFAVRSYADDEAVQVVVREGVVALSGVGRLEEGDLGRLSADGRPTLRRGVDVDSLLGWLDGRLAFVDAPLATVLRSIERWHGVEMQLSDSSLARVPFTGTLTDASADAAVELVTATLGLQVRREGARRIVSAGPRFRLPTS